MNMKILSRRAHTSGITTVLVVGFMGIFMLVLGTVTSYAFQQGKYGRALFAREQALHIAEAGLEYYRWFIGHTPSIMTTGSGLVSPATYSVSDPEAGTIGSATITATPSFQCGVVQWADISSLGRASASVGFPRTISARYMKRSVAEYAFLYNSNVWLGAATTGVGPYHANNGLRMDGPSNSNVTASVSQMLCDSSFGCSPSSWQNGVFGNSTTTSLWKYPVPTIDFSGMALNFSTLKSYAQTLGIMLNPTSVTRAGVTQGSSFSSVGGVNNRGFHIVFNNDGTISVYRVTATNGNTIYSYNPLDGWRYDYPVIVSETLVASNISLPSGCSVIYSEAKTWIDGTVSGKITLIVADTGSFVPDLMLNNAISYAATDGSTGLTAVSEGNVQIGLIVPDTLNLRGIFVAQTGIYGRDYYSSQSGYLPAGYYQYNTRSQLNVTGTLVSNQRGAICWVSGATCSSGFLSRTNSYDRILAFAPPPFTPAVTSNYDYVLWQEQ